MSGSTRAYLDETPGETRGIVIDEDGCQRLLTEFEDDDPQQKLGASSVGRVARIEPHLKGVFVDLGVGDDIQAFLPTDGATRLHQGQKVEVEVVSERREAKGVTLRLLGEGQGEPRLIRPGPSVREWLTRFVPGRTPIEGAEAVEAGWRAVQEATEQPIVPAGPSVWVERTRAMVTVDLDYQAAAGRRNTPRDRLAANLRGIRASARALRLRSLGGLVAMDLIGTGHDGAALIKAAKAEFGGDPNIVFGPVNRFGVMMLSLPWRFQPWDERPGRSPHSPRATAVEAIRHLRHALLTATASPRVTVRCSPAVADRAVVLAPRLGPRAHVTRDAGLGPGRFVVEAD